MTQVRCELDYGKDVCLARVDERGNCTRRGGHHDAAGSWVPDPVYAPTAGEQRRAASAIERALGPLDAARVMEMLGIDPDVFRLQWARTVQLGKAGSVTLALDLDVRLLASDEKGFVRALYRTLGELIALADQARWVR